MKNIEKYFDELSEAYDRDIVCVGYEKITGKQAGFDCNQECRSCQRRILEWFCEEYEQTVPIVTLAEYQILKQLPEKYKWIAKDHGKEYVSIYETKPLFDSQVDPLNWYTQNDFEDLELLSGFFKFVSFNDEEPWEIASLIRAYEVFHHE